MSIRPGQAKGPWVGSGGGGAPPSPTNTPAWFKVSFTHTDLQAAALTNSITAYSLSARQVFHGAILKQTTLFAGVGITDYKVALGIAGDLDRHLPFYDVDVAVADTTFCQAGMVLEAFDWGSATLLLLSAVSVGANLNASTAGALDLWLLLSRAPV